MARFIFNLMELGVSTAVHLLFGFYIFSTAVAADLSQAAVASGSLLLRRPGPPPAPAPAEEGFLDVAAAGQDDEHRGAAPVVLDGSPPPIVLVHGIFGFGKGVRFSFLSRGRAVFGEMPRRYAHVSVLLPGAEARRALVLRRRREEGRPRARTGPRLAHQHP
jgi:hypothetical protein